MQISLRDRLRIRRRNSDDWHTVGTKGGVSESRRDPGRTSNFHSTNTFQDDPGGFRTHDLRIKSPLLYQLSYRVSKQLQDKRELGALDVLPSPPSKYHKSALTSPV